MISRINSERGIALALVMWLLVVFVVLVSGLVAATKSDLRAVWNFKEDRQAYFLANAGVQMAISEILADSHFHYYDENGQIVFASIGSEEAESLSASRTDIPLGGGLVSYVITDENSKLNLNRLAREEPLLRTLLEYTIPAETEEFDIALGSIIDWVDIDDMINVNGAETEYYQSLDPPYNSKNAEFETLGELKRVNGVTDEIYDAIEPYLTVYPIGNINFNTAEELVLRVSEIAEVELILAERSRNGFYNEAGISDVFVITSWGRYEGSKLVHVIRAVVKKTGERKVTILSWEDDLPENPQNLFALEEE